MDKLKPCPFCGGRIKYNTIMLTIEETCIEAECEGCRMVFRHTQDFVYSKIAKVARNESFETIWNRRANDGEKAD